MSWSFELLEYDIHFVPQGSKKSQVLPVFLVESSTPSGEDVPHVRTLLVDDVSNLKESGCVVVLEDRRNIVIEQLPMFKFKAHNNQAEYEALVTGMNLSIEIGVFNLKACRDY